MTLAAPKTIEEAEAWFNSNAQEAGFVSDFGGDIEGGGVYAGTLLQLKFGNDFDPEIVKAISAAHPGAWTYK